MLVKHPRPKSLSSCDYSVDIAIVSPRESRRLTQCVAGPLKRSLIEPLLKPTEPETVPKPV
jgi:hypothetical protein